MQAPNLVTLLLDGNAVLPDRKVQLTAQLSPAVLSQEGATVQFEVDQQPVRPEEYDRTKAVYQAPNQPGTRHVAIVRLLDKTGWQIAFSQKRIYIVTDAMQHFHISAPREPVTEGTQVALSAAFNGSVEETLKRLYMKIEWDTKGLGSIASPPPGLTAKWNTSGLKVGAYEVAAWLTDEEDEDVIMAGGSAIRATEQIEVKASPLARGDVVPVSLQRSTTPHTRDQALWSAIRDTTTRLQFSGSGYQDFIDRVLGQAVVPPTLPGGAQLATQVADAAPFVYGGGAFDLLKTATQVFLLLEAGVVSINDPNAPYPHHYRFDSDEESGRVGSLVTRDTIKEQLTSYLGSNSRLPYLDRVIRVAFPDDASRPYIDTFYSYGLLQARATNPSLIELIWSYWHEEGMLVQTMAAISRRFQNVRGPGDRDPLAHLEIDPLRPLNNLLWGYIQDEWNRLTLQRRAYEYDHHYGLSMYGKAVPTPRTADSRSKFIEAFHHLLHLCSVFYKEDNDTTVIADGFPLLNALKEVHLLLAQGAHNQFGDLPWTARVEMLIQQWLLARPEMRDFLQSRPMVPYKEAWMPQVDTMKTLQGWTDVTVTHFRDLGVYGEQILLSIRYGDWIGINDENSAKNWARYWRPEVQGYLHAYRAVTGVDLTNPETVDTTMPAIHLQRRLPMQRIH